MNSPPLSPASWRADKNSAQWLNKEKILKKADVVINGNEVKQPAGSLVDLPPDGLSWDPSKASRFHLVCKTHT